MFLKNFPFKASVDTLVLFPYLPGKINTGAEKIRALSLSRPSILITKTYRTGQMTFTLETGTNLRRRKTKTEKNAVEKDYIFT